MSRDAERGAGWEREVLRLEEGHTWQAPPGYKVFVADRGAVRFNIPRDWVAVPRSSCIELYDQTPPNDQCRLSVSWLRLPPVEWSALPVAQMIERATQSHIAATESLGELVMVQRADVEAVWREIRFLDPQAKREALTRVAVVRALNLQALLTLDYWASDALRVSLVWDEVLRSVELGRYVNDPSRGDVLS